MGIYSIRKTNDWKGVNKLSQRHLDVEIDKTKKSQAWFVWHKGFIVGFCTIEILPYKIAYLTRAAIDFEHRGRGLHSRMLVVRESFARRNNCKKIITYVSKCNYSSLKTLIRKNYRMYTPELAWVGDDFIYLIKDI